MLLVDEIKAISSTKTELKKFGVLLGVVSVIIGSYLYWDGKIVHYYIFIIGFLLTSVGILIPIYLLPFHKIWMGIAIILGFFVSRIVLSLIFYFVVTPLGLVLRISGLDLLNLKNDKNPDSYWLKRENGTAEKSSPENQY